MTSDLVVRLLAEIARAERTAQDARGVPWQAVKNALMDSRPSVAVRAPAVGFLNENDPDTVLRRCAADRKTVERYQLMVAVCDEMLGRGKHGWELPTFVDIEAELRARDALVDAQIEVRVLAGVIRDLAKGYGLDRRLLADIERDRADG